MLLATMFHKKNLLSIKLFKHKQSIQRIYISSSLTHLLVKIDSLPNIFVSV